MTRPIDTCVDPNAKPWFGSEADDCWHSGILPRLGLVELGRLRQVSRKARRVVESPAAMDAWDRALEARDAQPGAPGGSPVPPPRGPFSDGEAQRQAFRGFVAGQRRARAEKAAAANLAAGQHLGVLVARWPLAVRSQDARLTFDAAGNYATHAVADALQPRPAVDLRDGKRPAPASYGARLMGTCTRVQLSGNVLSTPKTWTVTTRAGAADEVWSSRFGTELRPGGRRTACALPMRASAVSWAPGTAPYVALRAADAAWTVHDLATGDVALGGIAALGWRDDGGALLCKRGEAWQWHNLRDRTCAVLPYSEVALTHDGTVAVGPEHGLALGRGAGRAAWHWFRPPGTDGPIPPAVPAAVFARSDAPRLCFSPTGRHVTMAWQTGRFLRVLSTHSPFDSSTLPLTDAAGAAMQQWSSDGSVLAYCAEPRSIYFYNVHTYCVTGIPCTFATLADFDRARFSPSGSYFALPGDLETRLFRTATGTQATLELPASDSVHWSADGLRLGLSGTSTTRGRVVYFGEPPPRVAPCRWPAARSVAIAATMMTAASATIAAVTLGVVTHPAAIVALCVPAIMIAPPAAIMTWALLLVASPVVKTALACALATSVGCCLWLVADRALRPFDRFPATAAA